MDTPRARPWRCHAHVHGIATRARMVYLPRLSTLGKHAPRPPNNCVLLGRGRVIVSKPVAPMMGLLHSTDPDDAGDDDEDDDDDDEDDGKGDDEGNGDEMVMIMFPNCSCTTGGAFALRRPTFGHSDSWTYFLSTPTYLTHGSTYHC